MLTTPQFRILLKYAEPLNIKLSIVTFIEKSSRYICEIQYFIPQEEVISSGIVSQFAQQDDRNSQYIFTIVKDCVNVITHFFVTENVPGDYQIGPLIEFKDEQCSISGNVFHSCDQY